MYLNSNKLFVCKHFNTSFTGSISKICFKEDEGQPVVQRFFGQKQFKGTVPQKIREFFSFQSISFGLKWPGVNFQVILLKVHWRLERDGAFKSRQCYSLKLSTNLRQGARKLLRTSKDRRLVPRVHIIHLGRLRWGEWRAQGQRREASKLGKWEQRDQPAIELMRHLHIRSLIFS